MELEDNEMNVEQARKVGMAYVAGIAYALGNKMSIDTALAQDEDKWITVHPSKNGKGSPVLIDSESGEVKGGMGGKLNGKKLSATKSTNHNDSGSSRKNANRTEEENKLSEIPEDKLRLLSKEEQHLVAKQKDKLSRIATDEIVKRNIGKSYEELVNEYGNEIEDVAVLPSKWTKQLFGESVEDNNVYCGKAYMLAHIIRHYGQFPLEYHTRIEDIILDNDEVIKDSDDRGTGYIFSKKFGKDKYHMVLSIRLVLDKNKKVKMYKSLSKNRNKKPYPTKDRVNVSVNAPSQFSRASN